MRNSRVITDHRKPILTQTMPSDFSIGSPPFTVEYSYFNCTGNTVILSLRNGLRLELKSEDSLSSSGFTVKVMYKFSKYTAERLCTYLANRDCPVDDAMYAFKEGLLVRPYKQGNRFIVVVDYRIEKKEFGMKGGAIYIADSDALLTMADTIDQASPHPYSEEQQRLQHGAEANSVSFVYKLELVDNSQRISNKYANINGDVFQVTPVRDPARADGLYRYCKKPHGAQHHDALSYETFYHLADLRQAGVYDTWDEAVYSGDSSLKKKEELLAAEHQSQMKKYDAEFAKQESTRAASLQQTQANEQKHQQDIELLVAKHQDSLNALREEQQRLAMKDHYDSRSYVRKDSSEFMKHLPVIILGVGTALAAMFAFF